jgi:bacteriorhodopsin
MGEVFLIQVFLYMVCWLLNDYLATMVSLIFGTMFFAILLVSLVVEVVERSRVPRWYFVFMLISVIAPLVSAGIYLSITQGLDWME